MIGANQTEKIIALADAGFFPAIQHIISNSLMTEIGGEAINRIYEIDFDLPDRIEEIDFNKPTFSNTCIRTIGANIEKYTNLDTEDKERIRILCAILDS